MSIDQAARTLLVAVLALGGCTGSGSQVPQTYALTVDVSDSGRFNVVGGLDITQDASGSGSSARLLLIGRDRPGGGGNLGFQLTMRAAEVRALVSGQVFTAFPPDNRITYPTDGGTIARAVHSMQLTVADDRQIRLRVEMGEFITSPPGSVVEPVPGPSATAVFSGLLSVGCGLNEQGPCVTQEDGTRACAYTTRADPSFATEFCRNARDEYGVRPLVD